MPNLTMDNLFSEAGGFPTWLVRLPQARDDRRLAARSALTLHEVARTAGKNAGWLIAQRADAVTGEVRVLILVYESQKTTAQQWELPFQRFWTPMVRTYEQFRADDDYRFIRRQFNSGDGSVEMGGKLWDDLLARQAARAASAVASQSASPPAPKPHDDVDDDETGLEIEPPPPVPASMERIFVDGAGVGPDGQTGSGFAFFRAQTRETGVEFVDGLTNNEAEYRAVLHALQLVSYCGTVEICSDSELVMKQLSGIFKTNKMELAQLRTQVRELVGARGLFVKYTWIPREQNLAGKVMEQAAAHRRRERARAEEQINAAHLRIADLRIMGAA